MTIEKSYLALLQSDNEILKLTGPIYYAVAPQSLKEPFAVLSSVSPGATREAKVFRPFFNLNLYSKSQYTCTESAEDLCNYIRFKSIVYDDFLFTNIRAERTQVLIQEDGTFCCPINIRFYAQRRS